MTRASLPAVAEAAPDRRVPSLTPILLLGSAGRVMLPGPDGPVEARTPARARVDLFDFADFLLARFPRLYVVDLEGIERNTPQLDYLQELTRDSEVWVDAGITSPDGVIDILVAGARTAVVSSGRLRGPRELERCLRLSAELAFELEFVSPGRLQGAEWWGEDGRAAADTVRSIGVPTILVSPRECAIDWSLVRQLADSGPTYVDGGFERRDSPLLGGSGATGGLFHVEAEIIAFSENPPAR